MKMATYSNKAGEVLTFDEYRLLRLNEPKPVIPTNADKFLVRPPEKLKVLIFKKTPIGRNQESVDSSTTK